MAGLVEKMKASKVLILAVLLALGLIVGGGIAAWDFLNQEPDIEALVGAEQDIAAQQPSTDVAVSSAYYVILPQPFVFNVIGDQRDRLVQVKVQLMVRGSRNETLAQQHIPLIESTLLQSFSAATVEQLRTASGRNDMQQQAVLALQNTLQAIVGSRVVERVLFTGFVMQ